MDCFDEYTTVMDIDKDIIEEVNEMLVPGNIIKIVLPRKDYQLRHIRAIVDDEYIVYKVWSKRKQYWFYFVDWWYKFYLEKEKGVLTLVEE